MPLLRHIRDAGIQIARHPLTKNDRMAAWLRWLRWQISSRLAPGPISIPFTSKARLLASPSMHGATSNYYTGLSEFEEMAFLLHTLRTEDFFLDVGANIGAFTILASSVVGSRSLAFEPDALAYDRLLLNLRINDIADLAEARRSIVGRTTGRTSFTCGLDSLNHVVPANSREPVSGTEIDSVALDTLPWTEIPCFVKIDTEGFESEVIGGADDLLANPGVRVVVIEIEHSQRYGVAPQDVFEQLCRFGFKPCRYEPMTRGITELEPRFTGEGSNVIFIKDLDWARKRCSTAEAFQVLGQNI